MKKLTLRSEHLTELSTDDMRRVAGGAPELATVSDGTCVCTSPLAAIDGGHIPLPACDVSAGSCVCAC